MGFPTSHLLRAATTATVQLSRFKLPHSGRWVLFTVVWLTGSSGSGQVTVRPSANRLEELQRVTPIESAAKRRATNTHSDNLINASLAHLSTHTALLVQPHRDGKQLGNWTKLPRGRGRRRDCFTLDERTINAGQDARSPPVWKNCSAASPTNSTHIKFTL